MVGLPLQGGMVPLFSNAKGYRNRAIIKITAMLLTLHIVLDILTPDYHWGRFYTNIYTWS